MNSLLRLPILLLVLLSTTTSALFAQIGFNSPTGVQPTQDFEVYGRSGFLVQRRYQYSTADPNGSLNTMSCGNPSPTLTATAGILLDPGGTNNYSPNLNCTQTISVPATINGIQTAGIELVFEDLDTEPIADIVYIRDVNNFEQAFSGNTPPARVIALSSSVTIRMTSNGNGIVGRGFRLRWRALLSEDAVSPAPTAFGTAMQFDMFRSAFRAGYGNMAMGLAAVALGYANSASGVGAAALGSNNVSNGYSATTFGASNTASGLLATAMGNLNVASGDYSTAIGTKVSTNSQSGAFIVGDADPNAGGLTINTVPNQFLGRFAGGYRLLTTSGSSTNGAVLSPNSSSWAAISDSTKKERFRPINHADMLRKIGTLKLGTWSYKGQKNRHYGPMAQDFYAAFGHDGLGQIGCDTLIESHDFTAVTLAGVQALVKENEQLRAQTQQLTAQLDDLRGRMQLVEKAMLGKRERVSWFRRKR